MFSKKPKPAEVDLTAGWTPELCQALIKFPTDRGIGFPSKDYFVLVDGFLLESNNFEVERRAYSHLELRVGDSFTNADIPIVISVLIDAETRSRFNERLSDTEVAGQGRIYGKAILNGRYTGDWKREICVPVFEWELYLSESEWNTVQEAAHLAGKSNFLRIGVRIGIPASVTEQTVEDDSMNTRLLIHRIWITSAVVVSARGLQGNAAFKSDMGME